jgi:hypothetical protein
MNCLLYDSSPTTFLHARSNAYGLRQKFVSGPAWDGGERCPPQNDSSRLWAFPVLTSLRKGMSDLGLELRKVTAPCRAFESIPEIKEMGGDGSAVVHVA